MIFLGIIVAIVIFTIIILIHELGHFLAARFFGVKVLEFGLGIPPRAKKLFKDKTGTIYTLNYLPLGGFVRLNGEESIKDRDYEDKSKFYNKTYLQKTIILLGGVFMNFLLASLIFTILFFIGVKPLGINDKIPTNLESKIIPSYSQAIKDGILIKKEGLLLDPLEGSLALKSGIYSGDIVIKVNNKKINSFQEFKNILSKNKNKEIILNLNNNKNIKIKLDNTGKIGAYVGDNIELNKNFEYKYGLLDSIKYGFKETYVQSVLTLKGLKILLKKIFFSQKSSDRQEALNQMSGPIGVVDFVSHSLKAGIIFLVIISAVISINLGVFNLLPIPALDGGRWLLLTINTLVKKIFGDNQKIDIFENFIHIVFFVFLIAISILIGYNDVVKILNR